MNKKIKDYLIELSSKKVRSDDEEFNAYEWSGGNYDDAYSMGEQDGEIILARYLLEKFDA